MRFSTALVPAFVALATLAFVGVAAGQEPAMPAELQCLTVSADVSLISENDAERLCAGATTSRGPIGCYEAADDATTLSNVQLVELCRCAVDASPVVCFERARETTDLLDGEAIDRCRAIHVRKLREDCTPVRR